MGKDKSKKTEKKLQRKLETNPVGIHSVEDAQLLEQVQQTQHQSSNEDTQSNIPALVRDLDSVSESVRENACLALANIVLHENINESDTLQFLSANDDEEIADENAGFSEKQKKLIESSRQIWKTPQEVLLLMVQKGAVKKLIQKLMDPSKPVRLAAAGALRNVTIIAGVEYSDLLVREDIMTPLVFAFQQSIDAIIEANTNAITFTKNPSVLLELIKNGKKEKKQKSVEEALEDGEMEDDSSLQTDQIVARRIEKEKGKLFIQIEVLSEILFLLSYLCEQSEKATQLLLQQNDTITQKFLSVFMLDNSLQTIPNYSDLMDNISQCVQIISDSNPLFKDHVMRIGNFVPTMVQLIQSNSFSILTRVALAGTLFNVASLACNSQKELLEIIKQILPTLLDAASLDSVTQLNQILSIIMQQQQQQQQQEEEDEKIEPDTVKLWTMQVKAQKVALENVSNIVSYLTVDQSTEEEQDFDDEMMDEEEEAQLQQQDSNFEVHETSEFYNLLQSTQLLNRLFAIAKSCHFGSIHPLLLSTKEGIEKSQLIQQSLHRCILCITNTIVPCKATFLQQNDMLGLWNFCFELLVKVIQQFSTTNTIVLQELVETITMLQWNLLRKRISNLENIPMEQVQLFTQVAQLQSSETSRMNAIGILGQIGERKHTVEQNKMLAQFLLVKLSDTSLGVLSEVLNAIFDVYKDENFNSVLKELDVMSKLDAFLKYLTNKIKEDEPSLKQSGNGDIVARAREAKLNLSRFIKYKKKEMK